MKDLSDFIISEPDGFFVDVHDVETGERLWEDGERFRFTYEMVEYEGEARVESAMEEVSRVQKVQEDLDGTGNWIASHRYFMQTAEGI